MAKLEKFTQIENELNDREICIFEKKVDKKTKLLFVVDAQNFNSDSEWKNACDFIVSSLNNNIKK